MSQCHTEEARTRDRHYELRTTQRGGDDLEDLPRAFGERAERDQGPGGEVSSDRAFLMRLDAQESFSESAVGSPRIRFAEVNQIALGARPYDRFEERTTVAGSLISRKTPAERDNGAQESEGKPTKPSSSRMPRPSQKT